MKEDLIMNVLHINSNFENSSIHTNIVESMNKLDNVTGRVFYPASKALFEKRNGDFGDYVDMLPCMERYHKFFFDYRAKRMALKALELYQNPVFNHILAHSLFSNGSIASELKRKLNIPYSVIVTNTDVNVYFKKFPFFRKRGIKLLLDSSSVFFSSPAYLTDFTSKYVDRNYESAIRLKSKVVPFGIDDFWFRNAYTRSDFSKNIIKVLYVGKVNRNKNVRMLIQACDLLVNKGHKLNLTIIGNPTDWYGTQLTSQLRKGKYPYSQYYTGMDFRSLINFYRDSNVFVMPSRTESFGLVYAEAMSQGLPVVYTEGQGFDQQFEDGLIGYSVNSSSIEAIASAILRVHENYETLSQRASSLVNRFEWSAVASEFLR